MLVRRDLLRRCAALNDLEEREQDALSVVPDVALREAARIPVSRVISDWHDETHRNALFCLMKRMRSIVMAA